MYNLTLSLFSSVKAHAPTRPMFSGNKKTHSPQDLALLQKFNTMTPRAVAQKALSGGITPIQAQALTLFKLASHGRELHPYFVPTFVPRLMQQLETHGQSKKKKKKTKKPPSIINPFLHACETVIEKWPSASPVQRTLAGLTVIQTPTTNGHRLIDIQQALDIPHNNITSARHKLGLGVTSESRRVLAENRAQRQNIPPLTEKGLLRILQERGISETPHPDRIQDFLSLEPIAQQAFSIDTTHRNQHGKGATSKTLAHELNTAFELKIAPGVARDKLDDARAALDIEQKLSERYSKGSAKELHNERIARELDSATYKRLPENWHPETVTAAETIAAKAAFRKLSPRRLTRIVYIIRKKYYHLSIKEVTQMLCDEPFGFQLSSKRVSAIMNYVDRQLGIRKDTGTKRLETEALSLQLTAKLPKKVPSLGKTFTYANSEEAQLLWNDKHPNLSMTNYERALIVCMAEVARSEKRIIAASELAALAKDKFGIERDGETLRVALLRARKKLGISNSKEGVHCQNIATFNAKHSRYARTLPAKWWENLDGKSPLPTELAGRNFRELTPRHRIIFSFHCHFLETKKGLNARQKRVVDFLAWLNSNPKLPDEIRTMNIATVERLLRQSREKLVA